MPKLANLMLALMEALAFFQMTRINLKGLQEIEQFLGTIASRNHLILKWKDRPPGCPPMTGRLVSMCICMHYICVYAYVRYIYIYSIFSHEATRSSKDRELNLFALLV
jgi:hypothetical protein